MTFPASKYLLQAALLMMPGLLLAKGRYVAQATYRDFRLIQQSDAWLTSVNAAGLTAYQWRNISTAQVDWKLGQGDLVDYFQSAHTVQAGAQVESFYRLNRRSVLYGKMSYDNFSGRNMVGSAFIDPTRKPFDLSEDSLTNSGKKHRDTYRLVGAFGIDLWRGLAFGAKVDYTAANYAKYKDLRHRNTLMDMKFSVGMTAPVGRLLRLGANYFYRRSTESLRFTTYGKSEKPYQSLIDYAAFMGEVEQLGNYGFTDQTTTQPLVDEYNGGALQVALQAGRVSFFNSLQVVHRHGHYGRNSPYSILYTHHRANLYEYRGVLSLHRGHDLHQLTLNIDIENLENHKNTYRSMLNEAGSTYYAYYDAVKMANKVWTEGSLIYTAFLGICAERPVWTLQAGIRFMQRKQTAYRYPYFRRQDIRHTEPFVSVERNIPVGPSLLTATVGLAALWGSGEPFVDGTFATPSNKQSPPPTMDAYLYRNYHCLTARQQALHAALKYSFVVPGTLFPVYAKADFHWRHTPKSSPLLNNQHRSRLLLAVGCTF